MWLILAFMSAAMLGCYDSFKKQALKSNAVIPVLFFNTLFSSLIFLPCIVLSTTTDFLQGTIFQTASGGWEMHKYIVLKALIVLSSWKSLLSSCSVGAERRRESTSSMTAGFT